VTATQLNQLHLMFEEYEYQARTSVWSDANGAWEMVAATEYVRRFRGIRDGEQYLRAREGESFAHQLAADETTPRFTLICQQPASLKLDSAAGRHASREPRAD
jgi:hypothetical protein